MNRTKKSLHTALFVIKKKILFLGYPLLTLCANSILNVIFLGSLLSKNVSF